MSIITHYVAGTATIKLPSGSTYRKTMTAEEFEEVAELAMNDAYSNVYKIQTLEKIFAPKLAETKAKNEALERLNKDVLDSEIFKNYGNYVTIPSISDISVPEDLVVKILNAETKGDTAALEGYLNFWKLVSCNPDHRVRENLFWFLQKYHLHISRSGMFAAFRNVVEVQDSGLGMDPALVEFVQREYGKAKLKGDASIYNMVTFDGDYYRTSANSYFPEDTEVFGTLKELHEKLQMAGKQFTDGHSGTTDIRIGVPVTIPRSKCDANQDNTCSRGLHAASASYISAGYFGTVPLMVLINPADVVAVPPQDSYQKLRTCAYFPVMRLSYVDNEIQIPTIKDGFEDDISRAIIKEVVESFGINNEESDKYTFSTPVNLPGVSVNLEDMVKSIIAPDRVEEGSIKDFLGIEEDFLDIEDDAAEDEISDVDTDYDWDDDWDY